MTGLLADGVRLPLVLGHASVNLLNDIRADRAQEDRGDGVRGTGGRAIGAEDRDSRSGSHFVYLRSLGKRIEVSNCWSTAKDDRARITLS